MENLEIRTRQIVEEIIENYEELFLVDILIKGNVGNQKVLIFIDGDDGLNIDQCSKVSREVGAVLEEEDLIQGKYSLEVSSPGLDHPIKLKRQYKKNIGRQFEVEKLDGEVVSGELIKVNEDTLVLKTKGEQKEELMSFNEINQSKIEVSFK
jgi:ribosome maturation factor RimP